LFDLLELYFKSTDATKEEEEEEEEEEDDDDDRHNNTITESGFRNTLVARYSTE
jgi:hypothetical protein